VSEIARKHHFIPVFYLAGFTQSGDENDALWVLDQAQGKQWQSKPRAIAFQRDFYRVEGSGVEADAVEKAFGELEGKAARILARIREDQRLPTRNGAWPSEKPETPPPRLTLPICGRRFARGP
jgi:hypothetical protein